jgi:SPASM domain peptide maturase of grasp-with-spasm system
LNCIVLQINIVRDLGIATIKKMLDTFNSKRISSLNIYHPYNKDISNEIEYILNSYLRINSFVLFNSPDDVLTQYLNGNSIFLTVTSDLSSFKNCGNINIRNFSNNITFFSEAQKHNTCLNRKISVDTEGYIRNCPSMPEQYGNIKDTTLQEALQHPDFKKYWFVNKDQIDVCKDCEFRYICTDCRAYIENPDDMYSKPLKCGYNPYTCEWEEWSTNPLKQKAIDHFQLREIITV